MKVEVTPHPPIKVVIKVVIIVVIIFLKLPEIESKSDDVWYL